MAGPRSRLNLLAVTGATVAGLSTAFGAAPTHRRLGRQGRGPELLRMLVRWDRVRLAAAVVAAGAAVGAVPADPRA